MISVDTFVPTAPQWRFGSDSLEFLSDEGVRCLSQWDKSTCHGTEWLVSEKQMVDRIRELERELDEAQRRLDGPGGACATLVRGPLALPRADPNVLTRRARDRRAARRGSRRASDHPDPAAALSRLLEVGLLETVREGVRVVEIEAHIPPPSVRNKAEADKLRKRRQRAHGAGDHSMCIVGHCPHGVVHREVTRDPGTGQDGPVLATPDTPVTVTTSWPVKRPGLDQWVNPSTGALEEAS